MNIQTAKTLWQANNEFYKANAESFSATRHAPWNGWRAFAEMLRESLEAEEELKERTQSCKSAGVVGEALADGAACDAAARRATGEGDALGDGELGGTNSSARAPKGEANNDGARDAAPTLAESKPPSRNMDCAAGLSLFKQLSVVDLACGNMRFEQFLGEALPAYLMECHAFDNCSALALSAAAQGILGVSVMYRSLDAIGVLLDAWAAEAAADFTENPASNLSLRPTTGEAGFLASPHGRIVAPLADVLSRRMNIPSCDCAVSFGFMHHVPTQALRAAVLDALVSQVRPGGLVAVSFWRFMEHEALAAKAYETTAVGLEYLDLKPESLDEGDYLLGWKETEGPYRYCHSFISEEIDCLVSAVAGKAKLVARYMADGRSEDLNEYVVLQVR